MLALTVSSCPSLEDSFVRDKLPQLCEDAFWVCGVPAGCTLDEQHYVEGRFPGSQRVVVKTETPEATLEVSLYLQDMQSPGTELLIQLFEPDCAQDPTRSRVWLEEADLFAEAGDDRVLSFPLLAAEPGEHLLELYSDASTGYLLSAVVSPEAPARTAR